MACRSVLPVAAAAAWVVATAPALAGKPRPPPRDSTEQRLEPYVRRPLDPDDEPLRYAHRVVDPVGPRWHDGFYFRLAFGGGWLRSAFDARSSRFTEAPGETHTRFEGKASGFAGATELAVGATPVPGLAVGGGVFTVIAPSLGTTGVQVGSGQYEYATSQLALFAAAADLYPDPAAGFHVQGALGLGVYVPGQADARTYGPRARAHTALGPGIAGGIGYDAFVESEWSLGVAGRVQVAWVEGTDPESVEWSHTVTGWVLAMTATYH
ncbi:MAG: hypothetical protein IT376_19680 [Polyangiaceae bacterium]|nr:hypothetical protein [Polyangiaceae bacterium]